MLLRGARRCKLPCNRLRFPASVECISSFTQAEKRSSRLDKWMPFSCVAAAGLVGGIFVSQPAFSDKEPLFKFGVSNSPAPNDNNDIDIEKAVQEARDGVVQKLLHYDAANYPPLNVRSRGRQIAIRFPVHPGCDMYQLVASFISECGSGVKIRATNSAAVRELILSRDVEGGTLNVLIFEPLVVTKTMEVEFFKEGRFTSDELDMVVKAACLASKIRLEDPRKTKKAKGALERLERMGLQVYYGESREKLSWDSIAGYREQKREIEDNVLLALKRPEVYDSVARGTKIKFESNRPRAILFEGPPGCGKTSCARVIASQAGVPLVYVPLEAVTSKYYGESEKMLTSVFNAGNDLSGGAIVFLDEIDALATSRDNDMHEATRRMLSVLLRQLDGFEQDKRVVVIAATNRREDLDPALISRFDASITFDLPDLQTREEIVAQYAMHLTPKDHAQIAACSDGMSGRDLREVCQQAERRWASMIIKGMLGNPPSESLPPAHIYVEYAEKRRQSLARLEQVRKYKQTLNQKQTVLHG